ncbi:glutamyl-tRNA reductase [Natronosporangium hydrolyticum]|uniref:Glutamyl-tRNA reductase n=1 Tax=Natronosporangium hydrolyticum TaxID=2811111 RepID=A0A895Y9J4_9ACTN|nr:glutamyl-tRNA reductase [Natronosporangium hydrolyticum]QSB14434.1 glutamyl-tRNA reductase [Natronosporangium hydrolyticum]
MNLLVVGASYRTADVSLLERLAVAAQELPGLLTGLLRRDHVTEVAVLSTCNRVEVYAGVSTFHGGVADISATLAQRAGVDPALLAHHLYVHWDADAVTHTLRVAAGLDSMVAGETQILGQVREAYAAATDADTAGRLLHDLLQQALRVGKRAHAETGIDAAGRSVVSAALDLAATAAGATSLADRGALVVGTGSMGALALATLSRAGATPRYVASRTEQRAARLANAYAARPAVLSQLAAHMSEIDLVVSATASPHPVLTTEAIAAAVASRPAYRGPLVICDLAVPRDVEPAVGQLPGVELIDLPRLAAGEPSLATAEVAAAEELVAAEAATVSAGLRDVAVVPTVAALRARADEVVASELSRLAGRLPELSDDQQAEVAHAVHRLVQRLLHQPTVRVRQLAAGPDGHSYAAVLAELFDLQVPQPRRVDEVPDLTEPGGGAA